MQLNPYSLGIRSSQAEGSWVSLAYSWMQSIRSEIVGGLRKFQGVVIIL